MGWPHAPVLSGCSHPDPSGFRLCLINMFPQQHINKVSRVAVVDQQTETTQSETQNAKDCLRKCCLSKNLASDSSDGVLHFISRQRPCQASQKSGKEPASAFFVEAHTSDRTTHNLGLFKPRKIYRYFPEVDERHYISLQHDQTAHLKYASSFTYTSKRDAGGFL